MSHIMDVADRIQDALGSRLPKGIDIEWDAETDSIQIGNHLLHFVVTKKEIDDGVAVEVARERFQHLLNALDAVK